MIRDYEPKDRESIIRIGSCLDSFDIDKRGQFDKIKVYEEDGAVVGFIVFLSIYETIELLYVVVDPKYRRKSIGKSLVESLFKIDSINRILLEVSTLNTDAIKFYKKLGFTELRTIKNYYDGRIDALSMERVIK